MRLPVSFGITGLATLVLGSSLFIACGGGGDDARPEDDEGTGGKGGTGTGGTSGASTGGSGTGGSGNTCPQCMVQVCSKLPLPTDTINDFSNLRVDPMTPTFGIYGANDDSGMTKPEWWLGYYSGSFAYPAIPEACKGEPTPMYPITRTDVEGELHVTGTVGTYSGFGVWLGQCIVDMSDSTGVSFKIGGTTGSGMLKFSVNTNSNQAPDMCLTGKGTCNVDTAGACTPNSVSIAIPATPTVITVPWTDLMGGSPSATVNPEEVLQFQWDFDWSDTMTPYEIDVTVDDVMLSHD
jgi:hypothetical protein